MLWKGFVTVKIIYICLQTEIATTSSDVGMKSADPSSSMIRGSTDGGNEFASRDLASDSMNIQSRNHYGSRVFRKVFPEFPQGRAIKSPNYNYKGLKSSDTTPFMRPVNTKPFVPSQLIGSFIDGLPYLPFVQSENGSSQNAEEQEDGSPQSSHSGYQFDDSKDSDSYDGKDLHNPSHKQHFYSEESDYFMESAAMNQSNPQTDDLQESSVPHQSDMSYSPDTGTMNKEESNFYFNPDIPYSHSFYNNYKPNDEGDGSVEETPKHEFDSHAHIDEISFTTSKNFLPTMSEDSFDETYDHSTIPSKINYDDIRFTPPSKMTEGYQDDPHVYYSYMSPNKEKEPSSKAPMKYQMNHSPSKPDVSDSENHSSDFKIPHGKLKATYRPYKPEPPFGNYHLDDPPSESEETYEQFHSDSHNSTPESPYGKFHIDNPPTEAEISKGNAYGEDHPSPPPYKFVDVTKNPHMYNYEHHAPMKDTSDFHDVIEYEDHHVEHTTTSKPKEYHTFYYIGRKLWLVPLYAGLLFFIIVLVLLLKHISRHKIAYPHKYYSHLKERQLTYSYDISTTEQIINLLQNAENLYSTN